MRAILRHFEIETALVAVITGALSLPIARGIDQSRLDRGQEILGVWPMLAILLVLALPIVLTRAFDRTSAVDRLNYIACHLLAIALIAASLMLIHALLPQQTPRQKQSVRTRPNKTDAGRGLEWHLSCHRRFPLAVA
jgi:lysylphosphatidylglycerol synthetase-like protein (DUF2156 family)